MAGEHLGDQSPVIEPIVDRGPWGGNGYSTGQDALSFLDTLETAQTDMPFGAGETPRWDYGDKDSFAALVDFESGIPFIEPSDEVDGAEVGDFHRDLQELHVALPFSERERYWLLADCRGVGRAGLELSEAIITAEVTLISAGVRQVIRGRDLVRRWAAWRREADEFAGQRSVEQARGALYRIGRRLISSEERLAQEIRAFKNLADYEVPDSRTHS